MRRLPILLFLLTGFYSFSQSVRVDTLLFSVTRSPQYLEKFRFPVIHSGNTEIDALINTDLKNRFTNNDYPTLPVDSTLIKWAGNQLTYLNFEVTYNQNNILSLNIIAEGCGAYCTGWVSYYNYSTATGKNLAVTEVIEISGKLGKNIISSKDRQYEEQRAALKKMVEQKELDEETYQSAIEYYAPCDTAFEIKDFALYADHIAIIHDCYLPHVIQSLAPVIELNYQYPAIKKYLKIKI